VGVICLYGGTVFTVFIHLLPEWPEGYNNNPPVVSILIVYYDQEACASDELKQKLEQLRQAADA
jgi:hypothetical protein